MAPSLSADELASKLPPATKSSIFGFGAAKAATSSVRPMYSSPGQKVWPGVLAAVLAAVALGLCVHTAWAAIRDHREAERARHMSELETLRRRSPLEKVSRYPGFTYEPARGAGGGSAEQGPRGASASVLSSPPDMSPAVTIDNSRRNVHGMV